MWESCDSNPALGRSKMYTISTKTKGLEESRQHTAWALGTRVLEWGQTSRCGNCDMALGD